MEHWKSVLGYEGLYEVSDLGRVRSVDREIVCKNGVCKTICGVILTPRNGRKKHDKNRCRVALNKNGISKDFAISRLVAAAFVERNMDVDLTVNHIDGDPSNNVPKNLEWITQAENISKGFNDGLFSTCKSIILFNQETNNKRTFRSMAMASLSIGKCRSYISECIRTGCKIRGKNKDEYIVIKEENQK